MTWRVFALLSLLATSAAQATAHSMPAAQPRLIADNRTPYVVDISVFNGQTWNFVARLGPSSWQAFPNAASGSRWRGVFGQAAREHVVNYVFDQSYGGLQSVWLIQ